MAAQRPCQGRCEETARGSACSVAATCAAGARGPGSASARGHCPRRHRLHVPARHRHRGGGASAALLGAAWISAGSRSTGHRRQPPPSRSDLRPACAGPRRRCPHSILIGHGRPRRPHPPKSSDLLQEDRRFRRPTRSRAAAPTIRDEVVRARRSRPRRLLGRLRAASSSGSKPWTQVLDWKPPHAKWFVGGKLNASVNCVDRHLARRAPQQGRDHLGRRAGRPPHAHLLRPLPRGAASSRTCCKALGVKKGDRVALYMPLIPELAIAMLACARIGAVHSRGVRRLQRRVAARPHQRRAVHAARHRRRRLAPRQRRAAQADGRRGAARHAVDPERRRRAAAARRRAAGAHAGRARPLVAPS